MAIILSQPLTVQEIRVLQEFRRLSKESLASEAINAIKHPIGGGEDPARSLVEKGYLTRDESQQSYTLTQKSKDFLALDPKP